MNTIGGLVCKEDRKAVAVITSNAPWWWAAGMPISSSLQYFICDIQASPSWEKHPPTPACQSSPHRLDCQAVVACLTGPCSAPETSRRTWAGTEHSAVLQFHIFVHLLQWKKEGNVSWEGRRPERWCLFVFFCPDGHISGSCDTYDICSNV